MRMMPGRALAFAHLAQASGCRVPRVRENALAIRDLLGVELLEGLDLEVDLAAHLDERRDVLHRCRLQPHRDRLHVGDVVGDILADDAVAARGRAHEHAVDVAQVDGEPVDFELAEVVDAAAGVALDLRGPGQEFVDREHVVEAEHPLGVRDGCEQGGLGAAADGLGRAVLALQLGEQPLELLEPVHHPVVRLVGFERLVAARSRHLAARGCGRSAAALRASRHPVRAIV